MPLLQYDEHKPEDLDTDGEDHVADEVRYFLMNRPIKPRIPKKPDGYESNPLNVYLGIPKENLGKLRNRPKMEIISGGEDGER
jgi:hypothetical protein